jgi:hypothetical protein
MKFLRNRYADWLLLGAAIACIGAPFVAGAFANESILDQTVKVDQQVKEAAMISLPQEGSFDLKRSGKEVGSVKWEVYTSAANGFKLTASADSEPAMGTMVSDYDSALAAWSVGANERKFGFSASGPEALSSYGNSSSRKWRGFNGRRGIEIARKRNDPSAEVETTLWLASEMGASLPASASASATLTATAMANL